MIIKVLKGSKLVGLDKRFALRVAVARSEPSRPWTKRE
jgi:hypothetical protein